ncbi:DMT family transporter [Marinobacter zhejiangensis]|uniref:Threonine/homoserine efflux transporter RhtA n=1 Tax=Marinobacter zhejiangensis TaxID=488535 RepID=A0A1I4RLG9_9GAMM|nr:DMT family transporter [Marinobacter zhejiangensis]SFM53125.1 Threonine/homoserine efflux transporter RhtA [Marinobacter zhejiangensis]
MALTNTHKSDLLLVCVTLLAAISWMFSKEAVLLMPPVMFMAFRFLIAGATLAIVAIPSLQRLSSEQLRRSFMVGLVFGIAMSFWIKGLYYGEHLGEGAFLTSLGVVLVPIVDRLVFRQPQPWSTWAAIPIAVGGLACLSLENGFRTEIGQIYYVLAASIFALFFLMNTRAANSRCVTLPDGSTKALGPVPALPLSAITLLTVGLVALAESALTEPWHDTLPNLSWTLSGWVLASAIIGTAGRFFLQTYAQSLSNHSHGVVIMVLEPVWVAIFAANWFGETMSPTQMIGCGLIFAALLVNRWNTLMRVARKWITKRA